MFNIKKRFFLKDLKKTQASIWADQFAIFASRLEREEVRKQLVNAKSALHEVEARMKQNPQDKKLAQDGQLIQRKVEFLEKTIKDIDTIIEGSEPVADEPYTEPIQGLVERLEAKERKLQRLRDFIAEYC